MVTGGEGRAALGSIGAYPAVPGPREEPGCRPKSSVGGWGPAEGLCVIEDLSTAGEGGSRARHCLQVTLWCGRRAKGQRRQRGCVFGSRPRDKAPVPEVTGLGTKVRSRVSMSLGGALDASEQLTGEAGLEADIGGGALFPVPPPPGEVY